MSDSQKVPEGPRVPTRPLGSLVDFDRPLEPGARLGDWIVSSRIGEGGMGTVYAAQHAEIGKRAAIKVIRAALCANGGGERFVIEARVVNQIGHPNIVDIFHVGRLQDGRPYLVMELLRGQDLADRLAAGRIPTLEAIDVLLQICAALGAAHARGVIHRDLKPDNVFLVDGPHGITAKLLDWGIAKLDGVVEPEDSMTRTGRLFGTPQYMSPEQARAKSVGPATDIYSLGAIAYELFLESPPFTADNSADLITMHLREPVPPPRDVWPEIPEDLDALLLAMLAKSEGDRPPLDEVTARLILARRELERRSEQGRSRLARGTGAVPMTATGTVDESVPVMLVRHPTPTVSDPAPRRSRAPWIALGAVALVAAAAVAVLELRGPARTEAAAEAPPAPAPVATAEVPPPVARTPSMLDLHVQPARARIEIDGHAVAIEGALELVPGVHRVRITANGHAPYEREVTVPDGGTLVLEVELDRIRQGSAPRRATSRPPAAKAKAAPEPINRDGTIDPFE